MRPILCWHVQLVDMLFSQTQFCQKSMRRRQQLVKRLLPVLGIDEILNLHLLKLAGTEDKITRRNLITKRLTLLSDAKR